MLVKVERGAAVEIQGMDDLRSLSVQVAAGLSVKELDGALRRSGLTSKAAANTAEQVWLELDELKAAAHVDLQSDASWQAEWQAMISYATRKQWVSEDGSLVRAHVEVV